MTETPKLSALQLGARGAFSDNVIRLFADG